MTNATQFTPNDLVNCALEHYKSLPNHGKPREGQEWTVYAALLVTSCAGAPGSTNNKINTMKYHKPFVLCSATGSKCTTTGSKGWCLRDLHAEVLIKRGFQRLLWKEIQSGEFKLLQTLASDNTTLEDEQYALNEHLQLHLYISDSPCGDATLYELENGDLKFTGAKLIVKEKDTSRVDGSCLPCSDNLTTVMREEVQQLGQLRIKSGRSNLPNHLRSTSLSCSDKILKWTLLGLQGSRLPVRPVYLTSILVSRDPQAESVEAQLCAAQRAILERRNFVIQELKQDKKFCSSPYHHEFLVRLQQHKLSIRVLDVSFSCGKSQVEVASRRQVDSSNDARNENGKRCLESLTVDQEKKHNRKVKVSASGFCTNWQKDDGVEVLVGGRGTKNGKKCVLEADDIKVASRLCSRMLHALAGDAKSICNYGSPSKRLARKESVMNTKSLEGWVRSS